MKKPKPSVLDRIESVAMNGMMGAGLNLARSAMEKAQTERMLDALELLALSTYSNTFMTRGSEPAHRIEAHCSEIAGRIIARPRPKTSLKEAVAAGAVKP